jgi:intracellular sulfur oxidation DsrE/DsrF family protein
MLKTAFSLLSGAGLVLAIGAISKPYAGDDTRDASDKKQHRIVFHLSSPDTAAYRALNKQLANLREHWPGAQIEVVAHNQGVAMLRTDKSNVMQQVKAAMDQQVRFVVCEQTLKNMNIPKESIIQGAGFVERGLVEIVEKQEAGWSYIKAGF